MVTGGETFGSPTVPIAALLASARHFAYTVLRGTTITNESTAYVIRLNRRGIDHTLRHVSDTEAGRHHAQSLFSLRDVLAAASHVRSLHNADPVQRRSLRAVHHFEGWLVLDDRTYKVRLVVKETPDGYFLYDHRLFRDEPGPSTAMPYPHSQEGGDDRDEPGSLSV